MSQTLKVVEIFHSIQGEGSNSGLNCIFIRLQGCNMNCAFCDTKWDVGKEMSVNKILKTIRKYNSNTIVWTGGEPTLQLTDEILMNFIEYKNCIETNGTRPVPSMINYISVSPKISEEIVSQNISFADEVRYAVKYGDKLPDISKLPAANNYYISPIFNNKKACKRNLQYCLRLIKENPKWKLSVQIHNLLNIR